MLEYSMHRTALQSSISVTMVDRVNVGCNVADEIVLPAGDDNVTAAIGVLRDGQVLRPILALPVVIAVVAYHEQAEHLAVELNAVLIGRCGCSDRVALVHTKVWVDHRVHRARRPCQGIDNVRASSGDYRVLVRRSGLWSAGAVSSRGRVEVRHR